MYSHNGELHVYRHFLKLRGWISPSEPMGRVSFGIAQFSAITLAQALLDSITEKRTVISLLIPVFAVFGFMGITAMKRLFDVGCSRLWALLVAGPALLYIVLALPIAPPGTASAQVHKLAMFVFGGVFVAYCTMAIWLVVKPGSIARENAGLGGRSGRSPT